MNVLIVSFGSQIAIMRVYDACSDFILIKMITYHNT